MLAEAGHKCANPNCRNVITLDLHHITWVKDGGGNVVSNLIALCPYCHALHTRGHIGREAIETWKYLLESLNNPNRASADLLLVLYREDRDKAAAGQNHVPFCFTGDSLPGLAGLMNSGLVRISRRIANYGHFGGGMPYFHVEVAPKGRALVDAWLKGNHVASAKALSLAPGADAPDPSPVDAVQQVGQGDAHRSGNPSDVE